MKLSATALLLLAFISMTESVEDEGPNLRGREMPDEDGEDENLFTATSSEVAFVLGEPTFGGSGCPEGTVHIAPAPDGKSVTVIFDAYEASTSYNNYRDRKSCALAIPLKAKPGYSVGIFKIDYRGEAYVPQGRGYKSDFLAEYFFSGMRGPKVRKSFGKYGEGYEDDFTITNHVAAIVWSRCGASTNFRINTSIRASKPRRGGYSFDDTEIFIDTVDATVEHSFTYYLKYRRCH